jgi:hypothetical protein
MEFEVYCDESGLEALTRKEAHKYIGIGGIWIPAEYRNDLKNAINTIKARHHVFGELKWQKFSPAYFNLYRDLIDFFLSNENIRFRVVLIESDKVDNIQFNNKDPELGFYKFYYQLLHHWIFDFNTYDIFVDHKINRDKGRLKELRNVLDNSNLTSGIKQVQGLPSNQSLGIQLADFLTGMAVAKFNQELTSRAKLDLIEYFEKKYKSLAPSPKWEEKFNIFKINLKGGW